MRNEKDYYPPVARWFESKKGCESTKLELPFSGLTVLTGDIVGEQNGSAMFVCELKPYPYPIGASGYGSIGQALALRKNARYVYVACVASDSHDVKDRSWELVSRKRSVARLLSELSLPQPGSFDDYIDDVRAVFRHFISDLKLGLLVVREHKDAECKVYEVVEAPI